MLFKEIFSRYEFKYIISDVTFDKILHELEKYTKSDDFCDDNGLYTISSTYLDSAEKQFYYETLNKQIFRQKLRLRVYNECTENDMAFFEIKMKYQGMVRKRRTRMILKDAEDFIKACSSKDESIIDLFTCSNKQILREIFFLITFYKLTPKAVVSYERIALVSKDDPDLRITFDTGIRSRGDDLKLTSGNYGDYATDDKTVIMEVKTGKNVPDWLAEMLSRYGCINKSFSKYCSHYSKGVYQDEYESNERNNIKIGCY